MRLEFKDQPSLRVGSFLRMDLHAKTQIDVRGLSPHFETDEGAFDLNRIRFGISGEFLRHFEYEVEREFRGELRERESKYPWREAWVNFKVADELQVKAGKLKIPFSMEELTGVANLEFVNRSRVAMILLQAEILASSCMGECLAASWSMKRASPATTVRNRIPLPTREPAGPTLPERRPSPSVCSNCAEIGTKSGLVFPRFPRTSKRG